MTSPANYIKDTVTPTTNWLLSKTEHYHEYYHNLVEKYSEYEHRYHELINAYTNQEPEGDWDFERFRQILHRPSFAWPTLSLFFLSFFVWTFSLLLGTGVLLPEGYSAYPLWGLFVTLAPEQYPTCSLLVSIPLAIFCLAISSIASYASFTVAHDAIHRSLSTNRWFNDLCGRFAVLLLGPTSNYNGMKRCHLLHHKYTNNPEKDPDMFVSEHGPGGPLLMPLRWLFVDLAYWVTYFPIVSPLSRKCSTREMIIGWVDAIINISLCVYLWYFGYMGVCIQYWIIPSRVAMLILALAFDYLPHYPHDVNAQEDRYKTTSYLSTSFIVRPIFSLMILYQNYHIMHHLYPTVPFYRMQLLWKGEKNKLLNERNVHVTRLFTCFGKEILPEVVSKEEKDVNKKEKPEKKEKSE